MYKALMIFRILILLLPILALSQEQNPWQLVLQKYDVNSMIIGTKGHIVVAEDANVRLSKNSGKTWRTIDRAPHYIYALASGQKHWIGTDYALYFVDKQNNWTVTFKGTAITALAITPQSEVLLARKERGGQTSFLRSKDQGKTWDTLAIWPDIYVKAIASDSANRIVVGAEGKNGGIYFSNNNGKTWDRVKSVWGEIGSVAMAQGYIWAAGDSGVWLSQNGKHWISILKHKCQCFCLDPQDKIFTVVSTTTGLELFHSQNFGKDWVNKGLIVKKNKKYYEPLATHIGASNRYIFVALRGGSIKYGVWRRKRKR